MTSNRLLAEICQSCKRGSANSLISKCIDEGRSVLKFIFVPSLCMSLTSLDQVVVLLVIPK